MKYESELAIIRLMLKRYDELGIESAMTVYKRWCERMPRMNHQEVLDTFKKCRNIRGGNIMRLWHYELIPYLPKSQLIAQWRELNAIFSPNSKTNHVLINYIYKYHKKFLYHYTDMVIYEMLLRGIKINSYEKHNAYFKDMSSDKEIEIASRFNGYSEHNDRYLLQCFYNLQEKHDRKQKDFTEEQYLKLENYMKSRGLI